MNAFPIRPWMYVQVAVIARVILDLGQYVEANEPGPFDILYESSSIITHNEEIVDRELGRDLFGRNAHATQCHCLGPSEAQQAPASPPNATA